MIEEIKYNLRRISPFLKSLEEELSKNGKLFLIACGRTEAAISLYLRELSKRGFRIYHPSDRFFPADTPKEFVEKEKPIVLVVTGSGETPYVVATLESILPYDKIYLITMNENSSCAKMVEKKFIVKLKNYGIMRDSFEIFLSFIPRPQSVDKIFQVVEEALKKEYTQRIIDSLIKRSKVIIAGAGPAESVAKASAIRISHIKQAVGDFVSDSGELAGDLRPGDVVIFITYSGLKNNLIKRWYKRAMSCGAEIYFVSRNILNFENRLEFYIAAYLYTTFLAQRLKEKFEELGYSFEPRKYHSVFK